MDSEIDPKLNRLSESVIGAAISVHKDLGAGFAEITYHRALCIELDHLGIKYQSEYPVQLLYRGEKIGEGKIDLLLEGSLVVELKSSQSNPNLFRRQVVKYLKATGFELGLVINFEVDRLVDGIARVAHTPS